MNAPRPSLDERKAAVRRRLSIGAVVGAHVKLSGSSSSHRRRGQCLFHGSNSPSFALFDAHSGEGRAFCFGCQWTGDMFDFVRDVRGTDFMAALAELEALAGITASSSEAVGQQGRPASSSEAVGQQGRPVSRERNPARRRSADYVEPVDQARWIWRHARRDDAAVRRYFTARGVPQAVLTPARLAAFRYLPECPCTGWREGEDPRRVIHAPGIIGLMHSVQLQAPADASASSASGAGAPTGGRPCGPDGPFALPHGWSITFQPKGLHITYLAPDGSATMKRRKPWAKEGEEDPWLPKRRMLGSARGAALVLGEYDPAARLWVGEGNETVLSAMGLGGAGDGDCGIAVLSLDNLQGAPLLMQARESGERIWPLHRMQGDPARGPFVIPGHRGAVIGLIDADMSPLRGRRDRATGAFPGELVIKRKGGPIERRAITGAERARICAELFAQGWRRTGAASVEARRPPLGMDFNDAARELVA